MPDIRDVATQRAIADAYITNGGNQEQAVIAAGYSPRYAGETRTVWLQIVACRP